MFDFLPIDIRRYIIIEFKCIYKILQLSRIHYQNFISLRPKPEAKYLENAIKNCCLESVIYLSKKIPIFVIRDEVVVDALKYSKLINVLEMERKKRIIFNENIFSLFNEEILLNINNTGNFYLFERYLYCYFRNTWHDVKFLFKVSTMIIDFDLVYLYHVFFDRLFVDSHILRVCYSKSMKIIDYLSRSGYFVHYQDIKRCLKECSKHGYEFMEYFLKSFKSFNSIHSKKIITEYILENYDTFLICKLFDYIPYQNHINLFEDALMNNDIIIIKKLIKENKLDIIITKEIFNNTYSSDMNKEIIYIINKYIKDVEELKQNNINKRRKLI